MLAVERTFRFGPFHLLPNRRALSAKGRNVPLGGRPFDLLVALVEHRDRILSKEELKALVWPDALIVLDHTVVVTLASVRKALASEASAVRFVGTVAGRGYRFLAPVQSEETGPDLDTIEPASPTQLGSPAANPWPAVQDRLVGREAELATLLARLPTARLVTLWGPGGIGKTRLAIAAAAEAAAYYPDGIWFVELAPLGTPLLVVETLAALFGLAEGSGRAVEDIVTTFLRAKRLLLVLDNCEHLIEESARLAEVIIARCPWVTILATSRERLLIGGEWVYRVPPLATPSETQSVSAAEASGFGAVRLFVERARASHSDFALTAETTSTVCEICRRLDGLALAIELAAGGLDLMSPADLLMQLDTQIKAPVGRSRTKASRHRTLQSALDWSYGLLATAERSLLRRLSVFTSSFTLEAARAIAPDLAAQSADIVELLFALVDKSLVLPQNGHNGTSRFRLLESTRAYGKSKLDPAERQASFDRLARYLVGFYRQGERAWLTTSTDEWLRTYEPDLENLRTVLSWTFGPDGDATLGVELVAHAQELWLEIPLMRERHRWLEMAEARIGPAIPLPTLARLRMSAGRSAHVGDRRHIETAQEARRLFLQLDDPLGAAAAANAIGVFLLHPGEITEGEPYLREAEAVLRRAPPSKLLVSALMNQFVLRWFAGDTGGARAYLKEAHDLALRLGDKAMLNSAALNLAEIDFVAGRRDEAIALARSLQGICRQNGSLITLAGVSRNLAGYLITVGNASQARDPAVEGLRMATALGSDFIAAVCIQHLALLDAMKGDFARAARLAGFADRYFEIEGMTRETVEQALWQQLRERLACALPTNELNDLLAQGATWSTETAVEIALPATNGRDHSAR